MTFVDHRGLVDRLDARVVGRRTELEQVIAGLAAGRHLLLEGPPGTGKSTLLRSIAEELDQGFHFVEGNAELTPARLVGTFDPAAVLERGYRAEVFLDGPLTAALREGSLLYIEEINRIPEETLNVLIGVMSEGSIEVPRLGNVIAGDGFRLVAAMNPFDAIGTARISGAVYDRVCRLEMGYQEVADERAIVEARTSDATDMVGAEFIAASVGIVRATRRHPDLRTGSSVRGSIDLVLVAAQLAALRNAAAFDPAVSRDAAQLALSGRVRVRDGCSRSAAEIVDELWREHLAPRDAHDPASNEPDGGHDGGPKAHRHPPAVATTRRG